MKKRLLYIILLNFLFIILISGNISLAQASSLPDINGHWAQSEIEMLIKMNIVEGRTNKFGQKRFYPEAKITRAEFVVMLVNALPNINPKKDSTVYSYKDTHKHWAERFIEAATDAGITGGVGDGYFLPNEPIKRYEIAVMLVRAKKITAMKNSVKQFADVQKDFWFSYNLLLARSFGLISGDSQNNFKPFDNSTRAETAAMIARMLYL